MTGRRELGVAIGLCLVGSALVLLAVSRPWLTYRFGVAPLPVRRVNIAGAQLARGARALGLLGLAGVAALPATRRVGRILVGALIAVGGAGIVADVVRVLGRPGAAVARSGSMTDAHLGGAPDLGGWPYVALLGGLLLAAAGLLVVVRGRRWASMSARYDAPAGKRAEREPSLWEALDRGEDPTT